MNIVNISLISLLFSYNLATGAESIPRGTTIKVGVELNGNWPPYEFFKQVPGEKEEKVTGYSIDVINSIFSQHDLNIEFKFFPWKRVLKKLDAGEEVNMILPTSLNNERRTKYLVSKAVYKTTPSYYYMKNHYPDGVFISSPEELLSRKPVCGRLGYNYINFGIPNSHVLRRSRSYSDLIKKLKIGRCNIILSRHEPLVGYRLIGQPLLSHEIAHSTIPQTSPESFHFLISKKFSHSDALLQIVNDGIDKLHREGRLKKLIEKYE